MRGGALGRVEQGQHRLGLRRGAVGDEQVAAGLGLDPFEGAGRGDDRARHRHRLEHLVLDAARDLERRDHDVGGGEPGAHVGTSPVTITPCRSASACTAAVGLRPTMAKRASGRRADRAAAPRRANPRTASTLGG